MKLFLIVFIAITSGCSTSRNVDKNSGDQEVLNIVGISNKKVAKHCLSTDFQDDKDEYANLIITNTEACQQRFRLANKLEMAKKAYLIGIRSSAAEIIARKFGFIAAINNMNLKPEEAKTHLDFAKEDIHRAIKFTDEKQQIEIELIRTDRCISKFSADSIFQNARACGTRHFYLDETSFKEGFLEASLEVGNIRHLEEIDRLATAEYLKFIDKYKNNEIVDLL